MHTFLIVPHGIAARNFLFGRLLPELINRGSASVIHPLGPELVVNRFPENQCVSWIDSPPFSEGPLGYFIRKSFLHAHMRLCDTVGMQHMRREYRPPGGISPKRVVDELAWHYSRFGCSHHKLQNWTLQYGKIQRSRSAYKAYLQIFERDHPDVVFCCDQRPPEVAAVAVAARDLGIPVGTFIFSWDNLTSKGRMPCEFDFYCVWSKQMKGELLDFYPFVDPENVYVTGTPQFEHYFDVDRYQSRTEFCNEIGLDPDRPIICYAGEDERTDLEGPAHLSIVCRLIEQKRIRGNPQVLVRPTPTDNDARWQAVKNEHPEIIWSRPRWNKTPDSAWNRAIPTDDDLSLLTNIIRHSDCCINMVSTMTLDFAIGGKPTVNIAFDIDHPPPHGIPICEKHFQFEHYRPVVELNAAHIARSPDDLGEMVNLCLQNPDQNKSSREQLIRLAVDDLQENSSRRIANVLYRVKN